MPKGADFSPPQRQTRHHTVHHRLASGVQGELFPPFLTSVMNSLLCFLTNVTKQSLTQHGAGTELKFHLTSNIWAHKKTEPTLWLGEVQEAFQPGATREIRELSEDPPTSCAPHPQTPVRGQVDSSGRNPRTELPEERWLNRRSPCLLTWRHRII